MIHRFQRNSGVLPQQTLERLQGLRLIVAGTGGAGGQFVVDAARLGVQDFVLADPDTYERHNINRQWGAFEHTLGQKKIDVLRSAVLSINPEARVQCVYEGVGADSLNQVFPPGSNPSTSVVCENIDYSGLEAKILLHRHCRKNGYYVWTALMLGFGSLLYGFSPKALPYEEIFLNSGKFRLQTLIPEMPSYMDAETLKRLEAGEGHAPTCVVGATSCSSLMLSELVRFVDLGPSSCVDFPHYRWVDFLEGSGGIAKWVDHPSGIKESLDSMGRQAPGWVPQDLGAGS
jgi:molybdopterin/thiamine biosynthesis adenylyltransferase